MAWQARAETSPIWAVADLAAHDDLRDPAQDLAVLAWLTSEAGLAHVAPADRQTVRARLVRRYILALARAGLGEQALAVAAGIAPDQRAATLDDALPKTEAVIDGQAVTFYPTYADQRAGIDLAAADALAGHAQAARARLAALGLDQERRFRACVASRPPRPPGMPAWISPPGPACERGPWQGYGIDLLDTLLNRPDDDPFELAVDAPRGLGEPSHLWAEVACRVFTDPRYRAVCAAVRTNAAILAAYPSKERAADWERQARIVEAAHLPGHAARLRGFRAAILAAIRRSSVPAPTDRTAEWNYEPAATGFSERPLPAAYAERIAAAPLPTWTYDLAPLPPDFTPVRYDRDARRVVAISLSHAYDPTGFTRGGYWVHVSRDGGKNWGPPLYTGLSDHFPYVVLTDSRLPLLDGETLRVAVDVAQVDTASLTGPPFSEPKFKPGRQGLYLTIPLRALSADRDGDGLTDIAARHLLLAPQDGPTVFRVGADLGACPAKPTREQQAAILAIGQFADLWPDPRPAAERRAAAAADLKDPDKADRPVFVMGDPHDFACLRSTRMVLVFARDDILRFHRRAPGFRPSGVSSILFNRAHDRASFQWHGGWDSGDDRLIWSPSGWQIDEVGHGIS